MLDQKYVIWIIKILPVLLGKLSDVNSMRIGGHEQHENITISSCLANAPRQIVCECRNDEMVHLMSVKFGLSEDPTTPAIQTRSPPASPTCTPGPSDCQAPDLEEHMCVGRTRCAINLPTGQYGRLLPRCNQYANYVTVTYQCVPRTQVMDICTTARVTSQSGYITTPSYPHNYDPTPGVCTIEIDLNPEQKIYIYSIDFHLGDRCLDKLTLRGLHGDATICRDRGTEQLDFSTWGTLILTFNRTSSTEQKGFWLYYTAVPRITYTPTTPHSLTVQHPDLHSTSTSNHLLPPVGGSQEHRSTTDHPWSRDTTLANKQEGAQYSYTTHTVTPTARKQTDSNNKYAIAAIVGVVLVTILILLLVFLAILIKRMRKSDVKRSQSISQLTPKMTCSVISGNNGPFIQNEFKSTYPT